MRLFVITSLSALLVIINTNSYAERDTRGWAIAAGVGVSQIKDDDGDTNFKGDGLGTALDVEYRFSPQFALGLGFFSLGDTEDTINGAETEISARGYSLHGRFFFPSNSAIEPYVRFGSSLFTADVSSTEQIALTLDAAWEFGGGIEFLIDDAWSLRLDGRYLNADNDESALLVTAGFRFQF